MNPFFFVFLNPGSESIFSILFSETCEKDVEKEWAPYLSPRMRAAKLRFSYAESSVDQLMSLVSFFEGKSLKNHLERSMEELIVHLLSMACDLLLHFLELRLQAICLQAELTMKQSRIINLAIKCIKCIKCVGSIGS